MQPKTPLLPVDEARTRILDSLTPKPAQTLDIKDALGRILAEPLHARLTLPERDVSAMDGYAVRAADCAALPARLQRVGESAAGHPWAGTLAPGQAVRIFTGAVVPDGADTIILQEDVVASAEEDGASITLTEAAKPGQFIRPAGLDATAGDQVLSAGMVLSARAMALAFSCGHHAASFYTKPRIGIISTGDELVEPGSIPGPGQIIASNAAYLDAFVGACGGEAVNLGIARDRPGAMLEALRSANDLDMVVTTGGASVGVYDHVASDLDSSGGALNFWKIAMRPGKPLIFGHVDGIPLLGLPGNPVSSAVCSMVFLRPAIMHLLGQQAAALQDEVISARTSVPLPVNDQRQDYVRATIGNVDGDLPRVIPAFKQDSSMIKVLANASALIIRPPFDPAKQAGDIVQIMKIPPLL